jgi:hypothetical protein
MMPWRYQPVWVEYDDERTYTLVEAFFDDAGNLTYWTEGDSCPDGEDIEAVTADLNRMIVDALSWEPVRREDLTVGMTFRARISMDDRRAVADYVEANADAMKRQAKPLTN